MEEEEGFITTEATIMEEEEGFITTEATITTTIREGGGVGGGAMDPTDTVDGDTGITDMGGALEGLCSLWWLFW